MMNNEKEKTITFSLKDTKELEAKSILLTVYQALQEKGYNPLNQIVGYILSEDPVYMPDWNNARGIIRHIDRDDLLRLIIEYYLENRFPEI